MTFYESTSFRVYNGQCLCPIKRMKTIIMWWTILIVNNVMLSLHRFHRPPQNIVNGTFRKRSTNGTQPLVAHFKNQAKNNAQISIDL